MSIVGQSEVVPGFDALGVRAFTTTRAAGSFSLGGEEPVRHVFGRWAELMTHLQPGGSRLASLSQVHGRKVIVHGAGWEGWLRAPDADGHASTERGTGLAVSVADCVPVFIAHPSGAVALLHSGWRGTAAHIVQQAIDLLRGMGMEPADLQIHLGPAICGSCYEVGPDVYTKLTGSNPRGPTTVDLRALIAEHARASGVEQITASLSCTRCDNDRFFSHRAGDAGRQLAVIQANRVA